MKPDKTNFAEIDEWREIEERKRLRREILGIESYGWNGEELKMEGSLEGWK